jgi:hypothetical protein
MKTRLADILACADHLWKTPHGQRLAQKHVDFVLYDPVTTAIAAVIELDDRSHRQAARLRRDQFLDQAFRTARVPLLRVKAVRDYDMNVIRGGIERTVLKNVPATASKADGQAAGRPARLTPRVRGPRAGVQAAVTSRRT